MRQQKKLQEKGFKNFYIEAGGDIQVAGKNRDGKKWRIGIRNPHIKSQIIKVINISNGGVATSGTYERGEHIYNPHKNASSKSNIVSITVVGLNVYEADRFATGAFAMGEKGIAFIEKQKNLEGYMIDANRIATFTSGFEKYVATSH